MRSRSAGRFITGLAIALVVLAVVFAILPNPTMAYNEADVLVKVDCGAPLNGSEHSSEDFCEDTVTWRFLLIFLLVVCAVVLVLIGLVLLHVGKGPPGQYVERGRAW